MSQDSATSPYLEHAIAIRNDPDRHYNCAQGVLVPFAAEQGLDEELAYKLGECFGGGMRTGRTCGALVGTLMALGLIGKGDPATVAATIKRFAQAHDGCTECVELLKLSKQRGEVKKQHCDALVYEAVGVVEEALRGTTPTQA